MTEREYIDATNLAKARIAFRAWCDVLFTDPADRAAQTAVSRAMSKQIEKLENRVRCEEGREPGSLAFVAARGAGCTIEQAEAIRDAFRNAGEANP